MEAFASIKGTDIDVSDFVYAVNVEGSIAVMNTIRNHGILGWTHWATHGVLLDVELVDKRLILRINSSVGSFC